MKLRVDRWLVECTARRLHTDTARARAFGVDQSAITRVQNGNMTPGAVFIAAVLTTLNCRFEDVFEAVR